MSKWRDWSDFTALTPQSNGPAATNGNSGSQFGPNSAKRRYKTIGILRPHFCRSLVVSMKYLPTYCCSIYASKLNVSTIIPATDILATFAFHSAQLAWEAENRLLFDSTIFFLFSLLSLFASTLYMYNIETDFVAHMTLKSNRIKGG